MGCTYGSCYPRAEMPMLVDLYMAGKLKLDELVSRTFSLEEINTAFDVLDRGEVARSIIRYTLPRIHRKTTLGETVQS